MRRLFDFAPIYPDVCSTLNRIPGLFVLREVVIDWLKALNEAAI